MNSSVPKVLSIAGVDPSGGAGILADVKAMSAMGSYGMAVVAALTAQNTQGVSSVFPVPPAFVSAQIDAIFEDIEVHAVKLGMLGQQAVTRAVADSLRRWTPPYLVLDPVMVAKSGDTLLEKPAISELREGLLPLATVITPNLPEAGVLLSERPVDTLKEMRKTAEKLRRLLPDDDGHWVLLKGGHLPGDNTIDLLHDGDRLIELPGQRIHTRNTHGTGCTLSAALAALLARHHDVPKAAELAKQYMTGAITYADQLHVGQGNGPVHHFYPGLAAWQAPV